MPKQRRYSNLQLKEAVTSSISINQVISKLGLKNGGGTSKYIKELIKNLELDTSHFLGQSWNKGKRFTRIDIKEYLSNNRNISSHNLRLKLIESGFKEKKCEGCGNTHWLGKPIVLELDHIDGNKSNNNLSNLRILCPNCHSLTDTWKSKNKK